MPDQQPSDGPTDLPVLDTAVLDRMADDLGDVATVAAVADVYLDQLPGRLDELRSTLAGDPVTCRRVAHSLKSASAVLGLLAMADLCRRLELAVEPDPTSAPALLRAVEDASGPAQERLREWRASV